MKNGGSRNTCCLFLVLLSSFLSRRRNLQKRSQVVRQLGIEIENIYKDILLEKPSEEKQHYEEWGK